MLWNQLPVTSRLDHLGEAAFFLEEGTLRCWHLESYTRHIHWMCIQHHRELWNEDHQTKHLEKWASKNAIIHAPNSDNKDPSYVRFQLGKSYQKQCSPNKKQTVFSQQNTETVFSTKHRHTLYIPTHSVLLTKQTQKWMSCCQAKFTYVWRNVTWTVRRYSQSFVGGTGISIGGKHAAIQVRSEMLPKLYKHWCCCVLWLCLISDDAGRSSSDLAISVITTLRSSWFVGTGRTNEHKCEQGCNHLHWQDEMHSTGNVSIAKFCTKYTFTFHKRRTLARMSRSGKFKSVERDSCCIKQVYI